MWMDGTVTGSHTSEACKVSTRSTQAETTTSVPVKFSKEVE